jgi:hypothetical protein
MVRPRIMPAAVAADAIERSMPPEMITNVAPIASTKTTLFDFPMFMRLSQVRNTSSVSVR